MTKNGLSPAKITPRIVILEDEKLLVQLFEFCLHEWFAKFELLKFRSGDSAWEELSRTKPSLLIMDSAHPGLSGSDILARLAASQAGFPILLTSEFFEEHLQIFVDHGLKLGYLPKPFSIQEFWDALHKLVGPSDFPERHVRLKRIFEWRH